MRARSPRKTARACRPRDADQHHPSIGLIRGPQLVLLAVLLAVLLDRRPLLYPDRNPSKHNNHKLAPQQTRTHSVVITRNKTKGQFETHDPE